MRPATIRVIDFGFGEDFAASVTFAQNLVTALSIDQKPRDPEASHLAPAEVEFVRVRSPQTIAAAMRAPAHVLHLMAHGGKALGDIALSSDDGRHSYPLDDLADQLADAGGGIVAHVTLVDACNSAHVQFQRAFAGCLAEETVYVGAKPTIGWQEATTFVSAFYTAYLRRKGRGVAPLVRGEDAAERATKAYEAILGTTCPFTATRLQPRHRARLAASSS